MLLQEQSRPAPVVLIVEDDVLLRLVTAGSLREAGFEVLEAANAAEAMLVLASIIGGRIVFRHRHARHNGRSCIGAMGASARPRYESHPDLGCGKGARRRRGIRIISSQALRGDGCRTSVAKRSSLTLGTDPCSLGSRYQTLTGYFVYAVSRGTGTGGSDAGADATLSTTGRADRR
jgi:hypothetical protein